MAMRRRFVRAMLGSAFQGVGDTRVLPEDFRLGNRLLIFDTRPGSERYVGRISELALAGGVHERRLLVFLFQENGVVEFTASGGLRSSFLSEDGLLDKLGGSDVALVGLDGGVKSRYFASDFSWSDLFSRIDAMPTRQAEIRRSARGR